MEKIYKYHFGKRMIYSSLLYIASFIIFAIILTIIFNGGYVSAWYISLILAIVSLMTLSIPRRIVVDEEGIEIQCITEDTSLTYDNILSIRKIEQSKMNICIPIFGAVGFFGHYGLFFNLRTMELVHIYASEWRNFVEITDSERHKYYISCEESDDIVKRVEEYMQLYDTQEKI